MKLTKATVERLALPPGKNELLVFDEGLPGFGLRVRGGGKRTWIVQYRIGQKQRRVTLGNVETIDADNARRRAKKALSKVNLGTDPQLEKAETLYAGGIDVREHRRELSRALCVEAAQTAHLE